MCTIIEVPWIRYIVHQRSVNRRQSAIHSAQRLRIHFEMHKKALVQNHRRHHQAIATARANNIGQDIFVDLFVCSNRMNRKSVCVGMLCCCISLCLLPLIGFSIFQIGMNSICGKQKPFAKVK